MNRPHEATLQNGAGRWAAARCGVATLSLLLTLALGTWPAPLRAEPESGASEDGPHDWVRPHDGYRMGPDTLPSLEDRDLGEPWTEDGEPVVWDRMLPLFAQDVVDLGFDLPNPYGFAFIGYWQEQDLVLRDLSVSINQGPVREIDFVDFGTPSVNNGSFQFKLDAWLLPFLNIYTTVGRFYGEARVPLAIPGADILDFLGFGGLCTGGPLEPQLCRETVTSVAKPEYEGTNVTIGATVAAGWRQFFFTMPVSYAWANVNILDDFTGALNISPRIGIHGDVGELGGLAAYVGATYLRADVDVGGKASFDTSDSGVPGVPDRITVDFAIHQRNKDRWNYLVGFNWDINRSFSLHMEGGFGGSRQNFTGSVTYRF